ncbi:universal stress protein [Mariniflexile litorale]|uniref:Universal stress protein n=1 Tax=Mariniflexile litorale TaxID=3045158 RepID=A0AAU7EFB5_9FLAO|nr:universal stress protein [Mariniflexile sp. KMM 9835]MDQ8212435.1 universal stress protein [Mariniflexile sp. KMM 9835]
MMNILLPTDFSNNSWNAILYATRFFEKTPCNFYLLNVTRMENLVVGADTYIPTHEIIESIYIKPSKKKLRELLKKISHNINDNEKHKFYTLSDYNFFLESIRKHIDEKNMDMIIMGTKGASGLEEYIVGSNAGDVITKVKCTTLIVPEHAKYSEIKEVAFPTDYNLSYDIKTLQPLTNFLNAFEANLRIIHIDKKNTSLNTEQLSNKDLLNDYFEDFKPSFHLLTNKKVEDAIQCFVESRDIDMITMVAKNLNYFQSILFHSKVEKITYHTHIPFLVLHE